MMPTFPARIIFLLWTFHWTPVVASTTWKEGLKIDDGGGENDPSNAYPPLVHRTMEISLHALDGVSQEGASRVIGRRLWHRNAEEHAGRDDGTPGYEAATMLESNVLRVNLDEGSTTMTFRAKFRNDEQWYGECIEGSGASANFVLVSREEDNNNNQAPPRLIGSIRTAKGDTQYRVSTNAARKLVALATEGADRLEERALKRDDDDDDEEEEQRLPEEGPEQELSSFSVTQLSSDESFSVDEEAPTTRVDILVAYTRNAMCAAASRPFPCKDTELNRQFILDIIRSEVAGTNLAFELSRVTTRLNLVKAYMPPDYDEVRDADSEYGLILGQLTSPEYYDGHLEDVHKMRDKYGADVVAMMVASRQYCGMAWVYSSSNSAFSLTSWFCNAFTFAHEIGHNMGCFHNRDDSGFQHKYAHGYQDAYERYRTIMAYDCGFPSCPRIPYFSNRNLNMFDNGNAPVGSATEDCSLELNRLAERFANFRDEKMPDDNGENDGCEGGGKGGKGKGGKKGGNSCEGSRSKGKGKGSAGSSKGLSKHSRSSSAKGGKGKGGGDTKGSSKHSKGGKRVTTKSKMKKHSRVLRFAHFQE